MADNKDRTTDAQIDAAIERGKAFDRHPRVVSIKYEPSIDVFSLVLSTKDRFFIPRENLKELNGATEAQLSEIEIYAGLSLAWPQLDVDYYFPSLLKALGEPKNWFHSESDLNQSVTPATQPALSQNEAVAA